MASLTGSSIASSYTSLLKLNGNTDTLVAGASGAGIQVVDGDGTASPLYLNTDRLGIGGQPSRILESINTNAGADTLLLQLRNNSSNTSTSSSLRFVNSTSGTATAGGSEISSIRNANDGGSLTIKTAQASSATLTTALTIDESQNIGIGVTPHATHSDYDALYLGAKGMLTATSSAGADNVLYIGNNVHRDTDDSLEYIHGDEASMYAQQNGVHTFYVAGSGSAGDNISFTTAMSINSSGNVGIGTASPISSGVETSLHIYGNHASNNTVLVVEQDGGSSSALINIDSASGRDSYIQFQEAGTTKASVFNDASADAFVLTDGANSNTVFINANNVGIGSSPQTALSPNLTIEGASPALILRDSNSLANNFYTIYSANGDIEHYFDHEKSVSFATTTD